MIANKTIIRNKKTKEKFVIINYSLIGLLFGGTYVISNLKNGEIKKIWASTLRKKYELVIWNGKKDK